ncbi:MAG TPA: hypothetical protein VEK15_14950 [Vicinamibacteria bacterium]|nr:hypothetical protein [Vicinamibacteria bacterium]
MYQRTARQLILAVAGVYIVILGFVELGRGAMAVDPAVASELLRTVTTIASLSVGAILGFYIASPRREG